MRIIPVTGLFLQVRSLSPSLNAKTSCCRTFRNMIVLRKCFLRTAAGHRIQDAVNNLIQIFLCHSNNLRPFLIISDKTGQLPPLKLWEGSLEILKFPIKDKLLCRGGSYEVSSIIQNHIILNRKNGKRPHFWSILASFLPKFRPHYFLENRASSLFSTPKTLTLCKKAKKTYMGKYENFGD